MPIYELSSLISDLQNHQHSVAPEKTAQLLHIVESAIAENHASPSQKAELFALEEKFRVWLLPPLPAFPGSHTV